MEESFLVEEVVVDRMTAEQLDKDSLVGIQVEEGPIEAETLVDSEARLEVTVRLAVAFPLEPSQIAVLLLKVLEHWWWYQRFVL